MSEDMIDRVIYDETVDALRISILHARELADRIAALEAEASEGERRGLERALVAIGYCGAASGPDEPWHDQYDMGVSKCYDAVRALIPEAPAQPELASAAANQLSGSRVGEPAREGNPEDHPRYPALLADAKARGRNENLDGSPRRHAVAKEGE